MIVKKCNSCGRPCTWVETPKGKNMLLNVPQVSDPKELELLTEGWAHTRGLYIFTGDGSKVKPATMADVMYGHEAIYLTHYATCPDAKEWRKRDGV